MTTKVQVIFSNEDHEQQWNSLSLNPSFEFTATSFAKLTKGDTKDLDSVMLLLYAPTSQKDHEIFVSTKEIITMAPVIGVISEAPADFLVEKFGEARTLTAYPGEDRSATVNKLLEKMRAYKEQQPRRVKVIGFPFAGGQAKGGVELTPEWLKAQAWFSEMKAADGKPVEYEEVQVTNSCSNLLSPENENVYNDKGELLIKNASNVFKSTEQLEKLTTDALMEGYFPVVLGGDHSQALGSVGAFKKMYGS